MIPEIARVAGIMVLAVIFSLAYAEIGYYIALAIQVFDISLVAWVAAGLIALTVWAVRLVETDVRKTTRSGDAR